MLNGNVSLQFQTSEYPYSAQPPSIPAVPNHQISLQWPTTKYPCSAQQQPQSMPAALNSIEYPCSAQPHGIPAVPMTMYPCSAQTHSISAVPSPFNAEPHSICLCSAKLQYSCSAFQVLQGRQFKGEGAGKHYISCAIMAFGWGCSKQIIFVQISRLTEQCSELLALSWAV